MTSKIRIRMGEIEVEYEGTEDFLKKELPDLLSAVSELYRKKADVQNEADGPANGSRKGSTAATAGTTATIAGRLRAKVGNGRDLMIAAAARLSLVNGNETFTRKELLAEARSASAYYRDTINNNLSTTLARLVRAGDFNEVSPGNYSLSANKREELETALAAK